MMAPDKLSKDMLDMIRLFMKQISPDAKPTEFQEILTKAIATGLIEVLGKSGTVGASPAPVSVGVNGIGLVVQPDIMAKAAGGKMSLQTKRPVTPATDLILKAVMVTTALHLATALEVVSQTGFGGQGLPPVIEDSLISASIINSLPTDIKSNIAKSKHGADLINSIAFGYAAGLKISVPGLVPFGSTPPPPGLMQAVFK